MMNERIKTRRKELKLSQEALGKRVGVTKATVSQWENGITSPAGENMHKLCKALSTSSSFLLYGVEDKTRPSADGSFQGQMATWDNSTPLDKDEVEVPFYTEVNLSAGNGIIADIENHGPKLRFSKSSLRSQGVEHEAVACVKVSGNSMEPVLPNGSTVGIDTANKAIVDGKMYAINHDGMLRVKLLYNLPGNGLRLRSYNQDEYPDESYNGDQAKVITIIGRVFWYSVLL
ncbi:helix-turn-helix transcriptional regulator [Shewanella algae]|uniref:helix-turn-helix transcriptional regulator n=1 Tax=Shewanella algae TaxID=38313 RepID=UPI0031F59CE4